MHVRRQRRTCNRLLGALGATFAGSSLRLVERRVCLRWSFLFCSQDVSHSERLFTLLVGAQRRSGGWYESGHSRPLTRDTRGGRAARVESACLFPLEDGALAAVLLTCTQSSARKEATRESAHLSHGHVTACTQNPMVLTTQVSQALTPDVRVCFQSYTCTSTSTSTATLIFVQGTETFMLVVVPMRTYRT